MRLDRFLLAAAGAGSSGSGDASSGGASFGSAGTDGAISRRGLGLLLDAGRVSVNGRWARKGHRLELGDVVLVDLEDARVIADPAPTESVRLVLVTSDLIVMDKPAGVPSTAAPGRREGTAAGQLLSLFPELAKVGYGPREPGLVHRLDTQTSGLLLAARSQDAFTALCEQLHSGHIEKRYLALVYGAAPPSGRIDTELGPDPRNPKRVISTGTTGSTRVTTFRRVDVRRGHSLLEISLARGYRHQIRAHLASIELPLVGDVLYGGPASDLAPRHALHASYMAADRGRLRFVAESALPGDLSDLWSRLAAPDD
jgi:23S rRNA pseudouridine1911/1915/1917 synthase